MYALHLNKLLSLEEEEKDILNFPEVWQSLFELPSSNGRGEYIKYIWRYTVLLQTLLACVHYILHFTESQWLSKPIRK